MTNLSRSLWFFLAVSLAMLIGWWAYKMSRLGLDEDRLNALVRSSSQVDEEGLSALPQVAASDMKEWLARPVFIPTRRAPDKNKPLVSKTASFPADARLAGVVDSPAGPLAMVVTGAETHRLRVGEELFGWKITEILRDNIQIERDGDERNLAMFAEMKAPDAKALGEKSGGISDESAQQPGQDVATTDILEKLKQVMGAGPQPPTAQ